MKIRNKAIYIYKSNFVELNGIKLLFYNVSMLLLMYELKIIKNEKKLNAKSY